MKVTEISIFISRTFNLGNFESLKVEAGGGGSVESEEEIELLREQLVTECRKSLAKAYKEFKP